MGYWNLVTKPIRTPASVYPCESLSPSFCCYSAPCPPTPSLCSTVFILLQPRCFCGAFSVVDTMKTGRIHYFALHSSHSSTMNALFHHTVFVLFLVSVCLSLSCSRCCILGYFSIYGLSAHVCQWLIISVCLTVASATRGLHTSELTVKNSLISFFTAFFGPHKQSEKIPTTIKYSFKTFATLERHSWR